MNKKLVRVLIVDDSAFVRGILQKALGGDARIHVVGAACDGKDALPKIAGLRPDVVTLDVEMPGLSGIGVLERCAGKLPVAFVMCSTLTTAGAAVTLEALRKGAFDFVAKPQQGGFSHLPEFRKEIVTKVIAAARARERLRAAANAPRPSSPAAFSPQPVGWVVGIGISCGGPKTLHDMLPVFPRAFPPILVTQHMPAQFTGPFAAQLAKECQMHVQEAVHGEPVRPGTILIAPGSHHLRLRRSGAGLIVDLDEGPRVSGHRPSVDVMFGSMAQACGSRCVGVVMTGMGSDGTDGIRKLHAAGAWTVAQDAETSLVFGMPKAAAATGCVHKVASLQQIPETISKLVSGGIRSAASTV